MTRAASTDGSEYQTVPQAARRLGINAKALWLRVQRGRVPGARSFYCWRGEWLRKQIHVPTTYNPHSKRNA